VTGAHIYGPQISEFVLREALDHLQHAAAWRAGQLTRSWAPHDFREMAGTTWLVIGLGEIGGRIARTAHALGARVLGSARHEPTDLSGMAEYVSPDAVTDRLGDADVVVIARPALDDAVLVDRPFLDAMAPDSLLVNISRGSLVDEVALLAALDAGRPARAVLDVFASEPLPTDSPLWSHPKVVVTPHTSGQGDGRFARGAQVFAKLLRA
jgi:phosphoglycerate dehydrogenase-like enzyme